MSGAPPTRGATEKRRRVGLGGPALLVLTACSGELKPEGQVVVTVQTDLPVPRLAGTLRIDAFDSDGVWFESRTVATPSAADWPLSFGVGSRTPGTTSSVTLRLRAGPGGRLRDYRGERAAPAPTPHELRVPATMAALCDQGPVIDAPGTVWMRRGEVPLASPLDGCLVGGAAALAGVTALSVRVTRPDRYRVAVIDTYPSLTTWAPSAAALWVRRSCDDAASELACADALAPTVPATSGPTPPGVELDLQPGVYTVLLGSRPGDPQWTDLVVRVAPAAAWEEPPEVGPLVPVIEDDPALTPVLEPDPAVTVDRLVALEIPATGVRRHTVHLRGVCAGHPARLAAGHPVERLVPDEATTCLEVEGQSVPLREAQEPGPPGPGETFDRVRDCATPGDASRVCVSGGAFLLGDPRGFGDAPPDGSVPERVARLSPFYLDRHEVTVARYRAALAEGLALPDAQELERNPGPLARSLGQDAWRSCSFSVDPLPPPDDREEHALTCISWQAARAYCQHAGGDLPTEAQWEYAATVAGGDADREFPWGAAADPDCAAAVFGRFGAVDLTSTTAPGAYLELGTRTSDRCTEFGPLRVTAREGRDVTPDLGVVGLGGGVSEWTLDAAYPLDHACWRSAALDDPACSMDAAALRSVRGGSWAHGWHWLAGASRGHRAIERRAAPAAAYLGFRCAYPAEEAAP